MKLNKPIVELIKKSEIPIFEVENGDLNTNTDKIENKIKNQIKVLCGELHSISNLNNNEVKSLFSLNYLTYLILIFYFVNKLYFTIYCGALFAKLLYFLLFVLLLLLLLLFNYYHYYYYYFYYFYYCDLIVIISVIFNKTKKGEKYF
jgi:hypothetical protein